MHRYLASLAEMTGALLRIVVLESLLLAKHVVVLVVGVLRLKLIGSLLALIALECRDHFEYDLSVLLDWAQIILVIRAVKVV